MSRAEILLPLLCLALFGGVVAYFSRVAPEPDCSTTKSPSIAVAGSDQRTSRPATRAPQTPASQQLIADPQFNAARKSRIVPDIHSDPGEAMPSSWENPFSPELWVSSGWQFGKQSMSAPGPEATSATFRRPYHKLMLECDLLAVEAPGSTWELQLATRNAQVVMSFIVSDGRLSVVTIENGLAHVVAEKPLVASLSNSTPRQIRVVATGNRIVVSWDRKRLLSTEQLAAQSGREVVWSIHTSGAKYEIPRLRIEGD